MTITLAEWTKMVLALGAVWLLVHVIRRYVSRWLPCAHDFEARYDTTEQPMKNDLESYPGAWSAKDIRYPGAWSAKDIRSLCILESSAYVYDICVHCGITGGRDRVVAHRVEDELTR